MSRRLLKGALVATAFTSQLLMAQSSTCVDSHPLFEKIADHQPEQAEQVASALADEVTRLPPVCAGLVIRRSNAHARMGKALLHSTLATAQVLTVRARLIDQAGIPKDTLETAQEMAIYLAGTGGITLVWAKSGELSDFVFVVKNGECGAGKATLGQALLGEAHTGTYSYIYFNQILSTVLSTTRTTGLSPGNLLGNTIAHELGHLLGLPHTREGIMRSSWSRPQLALLARGGIRFSQTEALQMQAEIRVRRMPLYTSDLVAVATHKSSP